MGLADHFSPHDWHQATCLVRFATRLRSTCSLSLVQDLSLVTCVCSLLILGLLLLRMESAWEWTLCIWVSTSGLCLPLHLMEGCARAVPGVEADPSAAKRARRARSWHDSARIWGIRDVKVQTPAMSD